MTTPRIVERHQRGAVVTALAEGGVVAVPGCGGYVLAAGLGSAEALLALRGLVEERPGVLWHVAVGRTGDAPALAADWPDAARQLAEAVWPGPVVVEVPARDGVPFVDRDRGSVHVAVPKARDLRAACRQVGPLAVAAPLAPEGAPLTSVEEVQSQFGGAGLALILDEGRCRGPGPTIVDCRVSPPAVRRVGELPETYIDGVLLMAARRRPRFGFLSARRSAPK